MKTNPYPTPVGTKLTTRPVRLHMECTTPDGYVWKLSAIRENGTKETLVVMDEDQAEQWFGPLCRLREQKHD